MNNENLKPFAKGTDARRNTKGRPKSFKQLRQLFVSIASEEVNDKTRIEKMILKMLQSDNPADRALALKYGWGNVPDEVENNNSGTIKLMVEYAKPNTDDNPT